MKAPVHALVVTLAAVLVAGPSTPAQPVATRPCGGARLADLSDQGVRLIDGPDRHRHVERDSRSLALGTFASAPSWAPDGRRLAYARTTGGAGPSTLTSALIIADVLAPRWTTAVTLPANQYLEQVAWSPRGDQLAMTVRTVNTVAEAATWSTLGDRSTIWVIRPDGTGLRPVSSGLGATYDFGPVWAPDGHRLAYLSQGLVHVVDTDNPVPTAPPLDVRESTVTAISWSPDGRQLAVLRAPLSDVISAPLANHPKELLLMPPSGRPSRVLTKAHTWTAPVWHPNGRSIVLATYDQSRDQSALVAVDPRTGKRRALLTERSASIVQVALSSDGKRLAYTWYPSGTPGGGLATIRWDGRGRQVLAYDSSFGATWCPTWRALR